MPVLVDQRVCNVVVGCDARLLGTPRIAQACGGASVKGQKSGSARQSRSSRRAGEATKFVGKNKGRTRLKCFGEEGRR
eukprot:1726028-Rhodomonas_salina.1